MTLVATDPDNLDRGLPSPNSHDTIAPGQRMHHGTTSIAPRAQGAIDAGRLVMGDDSILATDNTTSAIFGRNPEGDMGLFLDRTDGGQEILRVGNDKQGNFGLMVGNGVVFDLFAGSDASGKRVVKVAKEGFDARTATDDELIFNSGQDIFKIVDVLSEPFSFVTGAGETTQAVTITHNLGYSPLRQSSITGSLLYIAPTDAPIPLIVPGSATATGLNLALVVADVLADATKIQYSISIFAGSGNTISGTITAYILQETASL